MARTFGSLVVAVLDNLNQIDPTAGAPDMDSIHAHRARRALFDVKNKYRSKELLFNRKKISFTPTASKANYDLAASPVSEAGVVAVRKFWYEDSDGTLQPGGVRPWTDVPRETGLTPIAFSDLWDRLNQDDSATTNDYVDSISYFNKELWVAPYPSGDRDFHLVIVVDPDEVSWKWDSSANEWRYTQTAKDYTATQMDARADTGGWFDDGGNLLIAAACRQLFEGPYADEKGRRKMNWKDREEEVYSDLLFDKRRLEHYGEVKPWI
jgi:hypothetical protein